MGQQTIRQEGAFTAENKKRINDNFTELYATGAGGGALLSAKIVVGNGSNVATAVAVSGDVSLANTGAMTVTGVNGAAVTATGTELDAAEAVIAALPTANVASPAIWNDNGVLKVGTV